jgi:hypothetical protein
MLERFKNRPLSHSQLSSFEWSPAAWYDTYILGQRTPATPEMLIGNVIGDAIGTDDNPIPDLNPPGVKEYELRATFNDIPMVGYCDHWCPDKLELHENKTSHNKKRWTKGKADKHDQLTMYAMLLNLQDGVEPEDITMYLNFIPVDMVGVSYVPHPNWRQFETRRTKEDIVTYQNKVMNLLTLMDEYASKRALSTPARKAPAFK